MALRRMRQWSMWFLIYTLILLSVPRANFYAQKPTMLQNAFPIGYDIVANATPDNVPIGFYPTIHVYTRYPNQPVDYSIAHDPAPGNNYVFAGYTDSNGYLRIVLPTVTQNDQGIWSVGVRISGTVNYYLGGGYNVALPDNFSFAITPHDIPIGGNATFSITGALPNTPITWSSWQNGIMRDDHQSYGFYTDAQGNWSQSIGPHLDPNLGNWTVIAQVGARPENGEEFEASASFKAGSYKPVLTVSPYVEVNGYQSIQVTGATPNTPIYWTVWLNGVLEDNDHFYGWYTDSQGNWSFPQQGPYGDNTKGVWMLRLRIGDNNVYATYHVGTDEISIPPEIVYTQSGILDEPGTGRKYVEVSSYDAEDPAGYSTVYRVFLDPSTVSSIAAATTPTAIGIEVNSLIMRRICSSSEPDGWHKLVAQLRESIDKNPDTCYKCVANRHLTCIEQHVDSVGNIQGAVVGGIIGCWLAGLAHPVTLLGGVACAEGVFLGGKYAKRGAQTTLNQCYCPPYSDCQTLLGKSCTYLGQPTGAHCF